MARGAVRRGVLAGLATVAGATPAAASSLVYTPVNPSFGGSPFNSSHLLGIANATNKYQDPAEKAASDPAKQFVDQLQSRLLSTVASQIADKIFGANAAATGHYTFGDQVIDFVRGAESVTLTILNTATNARTTITLPLLGAERMRIVTTSAAMAALLLLSACADGAKVASPSTWSPPHIAQPTGSQRTLETLPPAERKVAVAVYGFTDQTGQFKDADSVQTLSRAVTQGATSILIKALQDAGNRDFFQVIERERLDNLLRERAVIREMRAAYLGETELNTRALPPLLFAGILLEGGIIGYDSNTKTGGVGARFLGIGASTKYREDTVTVYLRAISTKTGEVLVSVNSRKQVVSVGAGADAFRYVAFKDLLEVDSGITYNEPVELALQQAVEKSVYALILEGAEHRLWCFRTQPDYAERLVRAHIAERDRLKLADVRLPADERGRTYSTACAAPGAPTVAATPPAIPKG